jgi:uncharacterized protein (DUF305 family)
MHKAKQEGMSHSEHMSHNQRMHYYHLALMAALSFVAMYGLMYAMVNSFANVYNNFNQFYMAGLMTAPMVLIELVVMRAMYQDQKLNAMVAGIGILALIGFFLMVRQQTLISDSQFLRSMIPHHAGAILMCEQAPIQDSQIKELCKNIISSQQSEIDQMKRMLSASP